MSECTRMESVCVCVCARAAAVMCIWHVVNKVSPMCVWDGMLYSFTSNSLHIQFISQRDTRGVGWGWRGRLGWVKAKEIQKEWYGSDRGGVEWVGWGGGRKSKEKRGVGGEKLNVNSSLSKEYPYQNQEYVWICKQQSRVMFIILHRRCQSRKK